MKGGNQSRRTRISPCYAADMRNKEIFLLDCSRFLDRHRHFDDLWFICIVVCIVPLTITSYVRFRIIKYFWLWCPLPFNIKIVNVSARAEVKVNVVWRLCEPIDLTLYSSTVRISILSIFPSVQFCKSLLFTLTSNFQNYISYNSFHDPRNFYTLYVHCRVFR